MTDIQRDRLDRLHRRVVALEIFAVVLALIVQGLIYLIVVSSV